VKRYWEIIADNLHKAGFTLGWVSTLDVEGRTIWIVDAQCGDGDRFIVRADEKLTAFIELESAIRWVPHFDMNICLTVVAIPENLDPDYKA
jgi:hypothetical protein